MLETTFFENHRVRIGYRLVENPHCSGNRCAVLLHGAGVGGVETFAPMYEYFTEWRWMLIPDLTGMGETTFLHGQEAPITIEQLSEDLEDLLDALMWEKFDLLGYSLGGLVALHLNARRGCSEANLILLEPASLDRASLEDLLDVRRRYRKAAEIIRQTGDVEQGIALFMDSVSPNRRKNPQVEEKTQSRLAHRPHGFAYALDAVTAWVEQAAQGQAIREQLIDSAKNVLLFSGAISHQGLIDHYQALADERLGWRHINLKGCDHSLPFQKPRQIAIHVNRWLVEKK